MSSSVLTDANRGDGDGGSAGKYLTLDGFRSEGIVGCCGATDDDNTSRECSSESVGGGGPDKRIDGLKESAEGRGNGSKLSGRF